MSVYSEESTSVYRQKNKLSAIFTAQSDGGLEAGQDPLPEPLGLVGGVGQGLEERHKVLDAAPVDGRNDFFQRPSVVVDQLAHLLEDLAPHGRRGPEQLGRRRGGDGRHCRGGQDAAREQLLPHLLARLFQ